MPKPKLNKFGVPRRVPCTYWLELQIRETIINRAKIKSGLAAKRKLKKTKISPSNIANDALKAALHLS